MQMVCIAPMTFQFSPLTSTPPIPITWAGILHLGLLVQPPLPLPIGPDPTLDDVLDSQADHRLRNHTQAPLPPQIPLEEETPMEDVGQDDPLQYSDTTRAALDHLLSQIDQTTSTVDINLTAESYAALAALPLSYPWSCLVLDLKELLPILDRYVLSCLIPSAAALNDELSHDQALFPLLKTLAQTIVNIISPQASLNTRPVLPQEIYKVEFWHAHLNYACLRASDAGLPADWLVINCATGTPYRPIPCSRPRIS